MVVVAKFVGSRNPCNEIPLSDFYEVEPLNQSLSINREEREHYDLSMIRSIYRDVAQAQVAIRQGNSRNNSVYVHLSNEITRLTRVAEDIISCSGYRLRDRANDIYREEFTRAIENEVKMQETMYDPGPQYVISEKEYNKAMKKPKILTKFDILDI